MAGPQGRPRRSLRGPQAASLATAIGLYVVLLMGMLVTESGSAQGCGRDWPLCNGRFIPSFALHTLVEYSHRSVAAVVGLLTAGAAIWAWRAAGRRPEVRLFAAVTAGFVVVQALLGAAAVLWPQPGAILALHFGISMIAFTAAALLWVVLRQIDQAGGIDRPDLALRRVPVRPATAWWTWLSLAYVYGLVYVGAYVAHTGAGLACDGWPLCHGSLVPPLSGAVEVQFLHRLGALVAAAVVAVLVVLARGERQRRPEVTRAAWWASALLAAQALSGGLVVGSGLADGAVILHGALVSLLFSVLGYMALSVAPEPAQRRGVGRPLAEAAGRAAGG